MISRLVTPTVGTKPLMIWYRKSVKPVTRSRFGLDSIKCILRQLRLSLTSLLFLYVPQRLFVLPIATFQPKL